MSCQTCIKRRYQLGGAQTDVIRIARRLTVNEESPRLRALLAKALDARDEQRQALDEHLAECEVAV